MAYVGTNKSLDKSSTSGRGLKSSGTSTSTSLKDPTRDAYLKSLNKKGSANYIPTPDDKGYENMDTISNDAALQKMADVNPEAADAKMDKLGYTGSPNDPARQAQDIVPYDQAIKGIQTSGQSSTDIANATNMLKQKYYNSKAQADASGQTAPLTKGQANPALPTPTETAPSPLTGITETDTTFDDIFKQYDDFFSPPKQKQSLLQEYKGLEKSLGIDSLNEELLNSKRIIEGTEDDIRSEVQAVSGFATDSQVLALANARNKSLVKNYNYLLESRDSAMTQLNTMMNLSVEDRKMATDEFDRKMNFAFKVKEFSDKAKSNAMEAYNNVIKTVGYAGLYQSLQQDPSSIPLVEKTLGLSSGQLQTLASQPKPKDLQFVSGTDNQPMGYFDKNSGKFTPLGGGSGNKTDVKLEAKITKGVETAETVLSKVAEATNKVTGGTTGFLGKLSSKVAGTSAYELARAVDTIQANIGFDTLQAMRDASPTGGALGQVSEREIALLQSTVASLDIGQSADILKKNLGEVASHYENWLHTVGYTVAPDGTVIKITDTK